MTVANSKNTQKDLKAVTDARQPETKATQIKTKTNEGIAKLSKLYPQETIDGLKKACAACPNFAEALNSNSDYQDLIYNALKTNPKLFSSDESINQVIKSFEKTTASYTKYDTELDNISKDEFSKAMTLHVKALFGDYGTKAQIESASSLFMSYGLGSLGKLGGIVKLAGSLNLIDAKSITNTLYSSSEHQNDLSNIQVPQITNER